MDILETLRADLSGATLARQHEVAQACGVPWPTLRKIIDKATTNPRYDTVERLRRYYMSPAERCVTASDAVPQQAAYYGRERLQQQGG
jgi:predicted transcriptional regulator